MGVVLVIGRHQLDDHAAQFLGRVTLTVGEDALALVDIGLHPYAQAFPEQLFLAAEVVVDGCAIEAGLVPDFSQRRGLETVRLELSPRDLDQFGPLGEIVATAFFKRGLASFRNVAGLNHARLTNATIH